MLIAAVAPLTGAQAPLGLQMAAAFKAVSGDAGDRIVDDRCTTEGGRAAADAFVARKVSVVVGFLCTEAMEAAMPVLAKREFP